VSILKLEGVFVLFEETSREVGAISPLYYKPIIPIH